MQPINQSVTPQYLRTRIDYSNDVAKKRVANRFIEEFGRWLAWNIKSSEGICFNTSCKELYILSEYFLIFVALNYGSVIKLHFKFSYQKVGGIDRIRQTSGWIVFVSMTLLSRGYGFMC